MAEHEARAVTIVGLFVVCWAGQESGKEVASARAGIELLSCPSHVPSQHCQMTVMGAKCSHSI